MSQHHHEKKSSPRIAVKSKVINPSDLFDSVVRNAIDFLEKSVADLQKRPKYSVINFCSALELFLKARLMCEHWSIIVLNSNEANLKKFLEGNFRSVSMKDSIRRIREILDESILPDGERCFESVYEHRNRLVHFFHDKYSYPIDKVTFQEIVAEQCKAWFYLHRLLTIRWERYFTKFAKQIGVLDRKMHRNREFLRAKYDAIKPEIDASRAGGAEYGRCRSCGFKAARLDEISSPLYQFSCQVCDAQSSFLRVECPQCGEKIIIEDLGEGQCENEDCEFPIDMDWLLSQFGPSYSKDAPNIAYCSHCEYSGGPVAIPFGGDYLCLACLELHKYANECGWCFELIAGFDPEDSYLSGCMLCKGRFGHRPDE